MLKAGGSVFISSLLLVVPECPGWWWRSISSGSVGKDYSHGRSFENPALPSLSLAFLELLSPVMAWDDTGGSLWKGCYIFVAVRLSRFSIAVIKHRDIEERDHLGLCSRGIRVHHGREEGMSVCSMHGSRYRKLGDHISFASMKQRERTESKISYELSKLTPRDILPPSSPHLLDHPKYTTNLWPSGQTYETMGHLFHLDLCIHSSFKTVSQWIAQASLHLASLPFQPSDCWAHGCVTPHTA